MLKWCDAVGNEISIGSKIIYFNIINHSINSSIRIVYDIGFTNSRGFHVPYIKAHHIKDEPDTKDDRITNLHNCVVIYEVD